MGGRYPARYSALVQMEATPLRHMAGVVLMFTSYIYTSEGELYGFCKVETGSRLMPQWARPANHCAGIAPAQTGFNYTDHEGE